MREIKFRFYGKASGTISPVFSLADVAKSSEEDGMYELFREDVLVAMQFTGRRDKNRDEIYEGDVIRHRLGDLFEVYFDSARFLIVPTEEGKSNVTSHWDDAHADWDDEFLPEDWEIVGNTYKNPELLTA